MTGNMLVAHGGGPTPVINCSLRGAVEEAKKHGEINGIYGARFGAVGILGGDLLDLGGVSETEIAKLSDTPASALGSCRRKLSEADYPRVLECFEKHKIRYFFYNGGNDSMDTCHQINQLALEAGYELRIIGIPKTIDNDLAETDHSPGFGSAARYAAISALELAMDAAALPIHVVVMEMMGRNAGWITAAAALFSGLMPCEHLVYLPERPLEKRRFLEDVSAAWDKKRGVLVTVSEGIKDPEGRPYGDTGIRDGFGHAIPGGTAQVLSDLIITELKLKSRSEKPGLLGRVSMAHRSPVDQAEAYEAGAFAVRSAVEGKSGFMVALETSRAPEYLSRMNLVPLERVANVEKTFPGAWINPEGNGVLNGFADYCFPLIGPGAPQYACLEREIVSRSFL
ncbi:MAG: diphosphate--fructose-6-phosphate 1-phosphotransferase [Treponema sp.]|nr:diphosphate--fructose-6-phosphate 1-phosphotransferase [Treponema sp.]